MKNTKKEVRDFENLYSPGSVTQKYDDVTQLVDLLERHNVPLDNFDERMYVHLLNFTIHTAIKWDEQIVQMNLEKDHYDADGAN